MKDKKKISKKIALAKQTQSSVVSVVPREVILDALDLRLKGYLPADVIEILKLQYPTLTDKDFNYIRSEVNLSICKMAEDDMFDLVTKHIVRYEKIYHWFRTNKLYDEASNILFLKEKLVGLHNQSVDLEINNIIGDETELSSEYDINKLSETEKQRMMFLLDKAK